jgi:hypothetical protein
MDRPDETKQRRYAMTVEEIETASEALDIISELDFIICKADSDNVEVNGTELHRKLTKLYNKVDGLINKPE